GAAGCRQPGRGAAPARQPAERRGTAGTQAGHHGRLRPGTGGPSAQRGQGIGRGTMSTKALVIAEHDNEVLKPATAAVVRAALQLADGVDILVAGSNCRAVAEAAARLEGVSGVLL